MDYLELIFLAHLCARHAHAAGTEDEVATTLWRMAEVYRAAAARLEGHQSELRNAMSGM